MFIKDIYPFHEEMEPEYYLVGLPDLEQSGAECPCLFLGISPHFEDRLLPEGPFLTIYHYLSPAACLL